MSQTFAVVIEKAEGNFSAHVPDLPGCVATGSTREIALAEIKTAIAFHLEGLASDAETLPAQRTSVETITV